MFAFFGVREDGFIELTCYNFTRRPVNLYLEPRVLTIDTKTGEDERVVLGSVGKAIGIESQPAATEGRGKDMPPSTAKVGHSKSCIPPRRSETASCEAGPVVTA